MRRWLTAIGLLATAEELIRRGDDAANSTALIAADVASEVTMGILGAWAGPPMPPEPKWHEILKRAVAGLAATGATFPPSLYDDLNQLHGLRNAAVHRGSYAPAREAQRACRAGRQVLDLLPSVATYFGALPPGAGIVSAIAGMIDAPELTQQLTIGEAALANGDASAATDAATRAHSAILDRLDPPITTGQGRTGWWARERQALGSAADRIQEMEHSIDQVRGWILAGALGMQPVTYRRLRRVLGRHMRTLGPDDMINRIAAPTLEEARWALLEVAEMCFRLWELDALIEGPTDKIWEGRA